MQKSNLVIFGVFAIVFAGVIPFIAFTGEGEPGSSETKVAQVDQDARDLFQTNCGSCHTLARAGTDGVVGPNLDDLLAGAPPEANEQRVLAAIENGVGGRMPAGILSGERAEQVADFVARVAGQ